MDFKERLAKITIKNSKAKHKKYQVWPMEKKIEVVSQYLITGNMKLVSALTGVDHGLIREWKGQPWWSELEKEIRLSQNLEMDTKLSKIVDKSLDAALDRVENGDFIYDQKSGEIRRKPAALRDVHRVAVDMLAKRELLRQGQRDRNEVAKVSVEEQLKMLAANLEQWVKKQQPVIELEEVENAVYEERETGLREGEQTLQQSPGEREEAGGTEPSPSGNDPSGEGSQG